LSGFGCVPGFQCGGWILGDFFSAFGSHKVAIGVDDNQSGNSIDTEFLFEGSDAGLISVGDCEPRHFRKVAFEGFGVAVNRNENYFKDFATRVNLRVPFSKVRSEKAAGRGPVSSEVETNVLTGAEACC
jgi:hypothetical protein